MNKVVLDASALLALLNQEPGHSVVEEHLADAIMSAVNVSEVIAVLFAAKLPQKDILDVIQDLIKEVIPFDANQAFIAAEMRTKTQAYGLSMGDRACLSLAKMKKIPVLTADKIWSKVDIGVSIEVIR